MRLYKHILSASSLLIGLTASAQTQASSFNRPPAGVEEAVRGRVLAFYGEQTEGRFRQAERFVCEASKDAYYDSEKRRWRSAEILKLTFEDDQKTAKVLTSLGIVIATRAGELPSSYPATTTWKLEENTWCLDMPRDTNRAVMTPFGLMQPGPARTQAGSQPGAPRPDVASVQALLKYSKQELRLRSDRASSDEIEITNTLPGRIQLFVDGMQLPGVTWTLSRNALAYGETAKLQVAFDGSDHTPKPVLQLDLRVDPLGRHLPVKVVFEVPADAVPPNPVAGPAKP